MKSVSIQYPQQSSRQQSIIALLIAAIAFLTVAAVWAFQSAGYAPCEICLTERIPYYVGIPLAVITALLQGTRRLESAGYVLLISTFAICAIIGFYHAGLEWHFWAGPTTCTSNFRSGQSISDLLEQLKKASIVRCDVVALRIFGLSLAVWNVIVSVALVSLALFGLLSRAANRRENA